jgi:hypothetical protein
MSGESPIQFTCDACNAALKAKPDLGGKSGVCPKCGSPVAVPGPEKPPPRRPAPLATERQKEYARELGIDSPEGITRREISELIDCAVASRVEERYRRLDDLGRRESEASQRMCQEVLAELDAEDCRLSKAEPSQIAEALSKRGFAVIVITMPWDDIVDFHDLAGVKANIAFCDDMTQDDMEATLEQAALWVRKRNRLK